MAEGDDLGGAEVVFHVCFQDRVEFFADPQEIRQDTFKMISDEIRTDELIDGLVRRKLESQRRVVEGSEEWDILYRKYFEEETDRHRRVLP